MAEDSVSSTGDNALDGIGMRVGPKGSLNGKPYAHRGWFSVDAEGTISGWMLNTRRLDHSLKLDVYADDAHLARISAAKFRSKLGELNVGHGNYGFLLKTSKLVISAARSITVRPVGHSDIGLTLDFSTGKLKAHSGPSTHEPEEEAEGATLPTFARKPSAKALRKSLGEFYADLNQSFMRREWEEFEDHEAALVQDGKFQRILLLGVRARLSRGNPQGGVVLLDLYHELYGVSEETNFLRASALIRVGKNLDAISPLRELFGQNWQRHRSGPELGRVLVNQINASSGHQRRALQEELKTVVQALVDTGERLPPFGLSVGKALSVAGANALAEILFDSAIERTKASPEAQIAKARHLIGSGRVDEGLALATDSLTTWPDNPEAKALISIFSNLSGLRSPSEPECGYLWAKRGELVLALDGGPDETVIGSIDDLTTALGELPNTWLLFGSPKDASPETIYETAKANMTWGFAETPEGLKLWRAPAVSDIVRAGQVTDLAALQADLLRVEHRYRKPPALSDAARVWLVSRYGAEKFGGVEHFMESMADHYRNLGKTPYLVASRQGEELMIDGYEITLDTDPDVIRRRLIEDDIELVHCFPGLAYPFVDAIRFTNIAFIYGVHFWRDAFGAVGSDEFFGEDGQPLVREEFNLVLSRASTVYVNSAYTQRIIEKAFGVRCPVLFSIPTDSFAQHEDQQHAA